MTGGRQKTSIAEYGLPIQNETQEGNTQAVGEGLCFPGRIKVYSLECMVGSEKPRHGLTLSKDVKNNEKGFYRYIIQKKKTKEIVLLSDK